MTDDLTPTQRLVGATLILHRACQDLPADWRPGFDQAIEQIADHAERAIRLAASVCTDAARAAQ